ncbi:MAG: hypothetical protein MUE60_16335 [Candidatus Eisenbacteria bacterium]|nr:hypothetical protein [Candidatus Eisenbacteria bacterium]
MKEAQVSPASPTPITKGSPLILLAVPLVSCLCSSIVGISLGQVGNLIYPALGSAGVCLAIPGLGILFLITFGLSFLVNSLMRRLFAGAGR